MTEVFTMDEVRLNNGKNGAHAWIAIKGVVYNVTDYLDEHPGGPELLLEYAGKDGSRAFDNVGHSSDALRILRRYKIGTLKKELNDLPRKSIIEIGNIEKVIKRKRKLLFLYCA